MNDHRIHIGSRCWHFRTFGEGPHLLFALHGFGKDSSIFSAWERSLGHAFTIIAVDLPFHGDAQDWPASKCRPRDFILLFHELHAYYGKRKCSLVGHSLGARIQEAIREKLNFSPASVWLFAPDGLSTRRMGPAKAIPGWMRGLIGFSVDKWHRIWIGLARVLRGLRLIDSFSLRFLRFHLANAGRRRRLMGIWRSLPKFPISKKKLRREARNSAYPIHLVIGKKDEMINWKRLAGWVMKWPPQYRHVLDEGHNLMAAAPDLLLEREGDDG